MRPPTDEAIREAAETVPAELERYGIDVDPFTAVHISREHQRSDAPAARGAYYGKADVVELYKPFFEQETAAEDLRPILMHEYVHKDQWIQLHDVEYPDDFREAYRDTEARYRRFLDDVASLGADRSRKRDRGLIGSRGVWLAYAQELLGDRYDTLYDIARSEAARWEKEGEDGRIAETASYFEDAVFDEVRPVDDHDNTFVSDRLDTVLAATDYDSLGVVPEKEVEAYYVSIATADRADDAAFREREYAEIRKEEKDYPEPETIVERVDAALDEHRRRRGAGEDETAIITDIRSDLRDALLAEYG